MEQKYKNIKLTKEFCIKRIKESEETLKYLREQCDHPDEYHEVVTYMTRPGQYWNNTTICGICGEVVKWPYEDMEIETFTSEEDD